MVAFALTSFFLACSEDENCTSTEKNEVSTIYELGQCNAYRQSEIIFVLNENAYYICNNNNWSKWIETNSSSFISSSQEEFHSSSSFFTFFSSSSSAATSPVEVVNGSITDPRDGHSYRVTTIGDQIWMAENLNYAYTGVPFNFNGNSSDSASWCYDTNPPVCVKLNGNISDSTSWCYDNNASYCTKYGRLYTWAAAMDSVGEWSTNGKGCGYGMWCYSVYGVVRGVCPEGWHLPRMTDWATLLSAVGGYLKAGIALKSTSGWNSGGNGTDAYTFSVLPAGLRNFISGASEREGNLAVFWSSEEASGASADAVIFGFSDGGASSNDYIKVSANSVRCVKDK